MTIKFCPRCETISNIESFSKGCSNCKDCEKKRLREYYQNNKKLSQSKENNKFVLQHKKNNYLRNKIKKLNLIIRNLQKELDYYKEDKK